MQSSTLRVFSRLQIRWSGAATHYSCKHCSIYRFHQTRKSPE
ncbi:hypothetical protein PAMC26510_05755 [Caballeronia sordidicola]|uniref:Uncharacterized protein n=1 Tax=Caballeronia sordidicola TaxID=196367 RepID=A0A242N6Q9_CABSO|nr:hypothetical protein PAMC26510_05755 [Caballeronia sordidicola]